MKNHIGLFEGIGGFSLAARWQGWETIAWVENDPFCQQILKKNFKNAKAYGNIKEFNGLPYRGKIDIITGGFPCQPFSHAGKRKGTEDDRFLWPEMLRVIREVQPAWVVGENVGGLLSMEDGETLSRILSDLEGEGYQVQSFVIPACAVEAPHRRDRIWIIANADNTGNGASKSENNTQPKYSGQNVNAPNATSERLERRFGESIQRNSNGSSNANQFQGKWYEVATKFCRVDDGVPRRLDKFRKERLKALGNAIVPQVAYEIFKSIDQL